MVDGGEGITCGGGWRLPGRGLNFSSKPSIAGMGPRREEAGKR